MKNTLIRSVIFDFDGLIMDTEYPIFQSWQELFHSQGGRLETSDWVHYVGTMDNERDFVEELEVQIGRKLDRKKLNDARWQRETELIAAQPLLPGVLSYLDDARRLGLKIGLASSSPWEWVGGHLTQRGLIDYFDCIRTRENVTRLKPEPELYYSVLAALELTPDQAIVLEDSSPGVTAARRAGLFCVAVPNQLTRLLPLDHANLLLKSLEDLSLEALLEKTAEARNGHGHL